MKPVAISLVNCSKAEVVECTGRKPCWSSDSFPTSPHAQIKDCEVCVVLVQLVKCDVCVSVLQREHSGKSSLSASICLDMMGGFAISLFELGESTTG